MNPVERIIRLVLSSEITLFATTFLFCLAAFYFMGQIISGVRAAQRWAFVPLSAVNAGTVLALERLGDGQTSALIIALIPAILIPEVAAICRDKWWPYLTLYFMAVLELLCFYSFSCAIINLGLHDYWVLGGDAHRHAIFSLTMLLTGTFFLATARSRATPISVLSGLVHDRSRSLLLLIYLAVASVVLAISTQSLSSLIYTDELSRHFEVAFHTDIVLKDGLILLCSFLIVLVQIWQEQSVRHSQELEKELQTEQEFRANLHSDSLFSYCANISKDCFVDGFGGFSIEEGAGYQETILTLMVNSIHPDDMGILSHLADIEYYEEKLLHDPSYTLCFRIFPKAFLAIPDFHAAPGLLGQLAEDREWIWVEFHVTVVRDTASGDILAYVSLDSVDQEMTERETLTRAASTDPLTGLLNRSGLEELVRVQLAQEGISGTLFIIDMDYFKNVNDLLGHPTGDQVLRDMADVLQSVFRGRDIVARLGGDEFCVFAPGLTDETIAVQRAEQLNNRASRIYTSPDRSQVVRVSLSIGGVICPPDSGASYEALYQQADAALYEAKAAGRDTCRFSLFTTHAVPAGH